MALYVRNAPTGTRTNTDNHMPICGAAILSFTNFSPNMFNRWKMRKKMMATTSGIPNPPFLMMEPNGAPMKKRIRHDSDSENFL